MVILNSIHLFDLKFTLWSLKRKKEKPKVIKTMNYPYNLTSNLWITINYVLILSTVLPSHLR